MNSIEKQHYIWMRKVIGFICIFLYPLCLLLGFSFGLSRNPINWWQNISSQYYTNSRALYCMGMGLLSFFFITYKGYDWKDRLVCSLVGWSTLINLIFPCKDKALIYDFPHGSEGVFNIDMNLSHLFHCISGVIVFVGLFVILRFIFTLNGGEITENKKKRNTIYKICAYIQITGMIMGFISTVIQIQNLLWMSMVAELVEFIAVGIAWLVKGEFIKSLQD